VLHGNGTVANALAVGEKGKYFNRFVVDVAAFVRTEENPPIPELHRSAKMIWEQADTQSPRLEIYIQNNMFRHLVELYVTKRIDRIVMSIKIEVIEWPMTELSSVTGILPLLDKDGHLYFRRTQCELLSVYASLARERTRV
jgi:hypothetical protein